MEVRYMLEDSQIIELFFERSEQAIAELSEKYGKVCSSVSRNILKNELDAEECVNDAYLAAWNTIPPQEPNPLLSYLCRIVRNLSLKKYHSNTAAKRNNYYDTTLDELVECIASNTTIENEVFAKELSQQLNSFLATLRQKDRVMFVRRYWYCDSVSEIASYFQMNSNAVSVRLLRIRERLRKYLKKEGIHV